MLGVMACWIQTSELGAILGELFRVMPGEAEMILLCWGGTQGFCTCETRVSACSHL